MKIENGKVLKEVKIITPFIFNDFRGTYVETFNKKEYSELKNFEGKEIDFVQDDISMSRRNTLRGLHGDQKTWKLIQCLMGTIFVAIVDMRPQSKNYLKYETFSLSDLDRRQLLVPAGFANGHLCLTEACIFSYKQSTYYEGKEKQFTVKWDDPSVGIRWPIKDPILSTRDVTAEYLKD
tara:strand:+ start:351 stop:887 length:537 start_codon:yes stop_codon:yes gene_type:complete